MKRFLAVFALLFVTGCIPLLTPPVTPTTPTETPTESTASVPVVPEIVPETVSNNTVWAKQLLKEYEENPILFNRNYIGKYYQITETVISFSDVSSVGNIDLGGSIETDNKFISLHYAKELVEQVAHLKKGDKVKLVCKLRGVQSTIMGDWISFDIHEIY